MSEDVFPIFGYGNSNLKVGICIRVLGDNLFFIKMVYDEICNNFFVGILR